MKKTQKIFALILCLVVILSNISVVNACKVGDIIGNTVYTDIIASINDYNIASFNINGYTAVVAEDLRDYGFSVTWDSTKRALYIKRGTTNSVSSTYIAPKIPKSITGNRAHNVLYTDIKTYINGNRVTSYNLGGKTIIYFDDLGVFGNIEYNNNIRRLDLEITDGLDYKISVPSSSYSRSGLYYEINSADGLQIRWFAKSNTNKTINYYTTTYYMFNAVGDFAYDRWGKTIFQSGLLDQ